MASRRERQCRLCTIVSTVSREIAESAKSSDALSSLETALVNSSDDLGHHVFVDEIAQTDEIRISCIEFSIIRQQSEKN